MQNGDVLIVTKLDRLGRNAMDIRKTVEQLATSDIPGLTPPDWEQVQRRDYEPWEREHLQLDTAILSATECVDTILTRIKPV